jgi:PIN domain nuclease of toxin-antitoxin system
VKLLLDTHTVLWFYLADARLSTSARSIIIDPGNEKWVSPATYWEVAIKVSTGKYAIAQSFEDFWHNAIELNSFRILHILPRHAARVATLPFPPNNHRDPFDRLILAQALVEGLQIVSADSELDAYGVSRLW